MITKGIPSDKIALAFKCAYFMGEKSQIITDMNVIYFWLRVNPPEALLYHLTNFSKSTNLTIPCWCLRKLTRKSQWMRILVATSQMWSNKFPSSSLSTPNMRRPCSSWSWKKRPINLAHTLLLHIPRCFLLLSGFCSLTAKILFWTNLQNSFQILIC